MLTYIGFAGVRLIELWFRISLLVKGGGKPQHNHSSSLELSLGGVERENFWGDRFEIQISTTGEGRSRGGGGHWGAGILKGGKEDCRCGRLRL